MAEVTPMPPDPRSGGSMVQSPPVPHDSAGVNVSTSRAASAMGTVTVGGLITVLAPLLHYFNPTEVHFMLAILGGASGIAIVAANAWAYLNFNSKSSRNTVAQIEYWSMLAQDLAKQLADGGKTLNPTAPLNVPPQAPPGGN